MQGRFDEIFEYNVENPNSSIYFEQAKALFYKKEFAKAQELLEKKGKTKYWLYKQLGMSYQNFSRMINNQTKSIRYENIETLCLLLECTPNELFEMTED